MSPQVETQPKLETIIIEEDQNFDLAIIGGGPAGMAAAIYAGRARLKTILVEKMVLGGMAATAFQIENYPGFPEAVSGLDLTQKMAEQVKKLGVAANWSTASELKKDGKLFELQVEGKKLHPKAVIIATGTETAKLKVPGEEEFHGRGVSYCATCDGAFYVDKNVFVVGGGNSAVEEALFLTRYAAKVSIVHRRDEFRADKILVERAKNHPKIYFFLHSVMEEIKGDSMVKSIVLKDLLSGKNLNVPTEGVFIYVGSRPNTASFKELIKTDEKGFILTDENLKTSTEGLFAAGDVRSKRLRQIVTAVSDGALAAESARLHIENLT